MMISRFCLIAAATVTMGLSACADKEHSVEKQLNKAHYWQRANTTSALYMSGPKAQQTLHRDISRCVVEVRELTRLGSLREAMPGEMDEHGNVPDPSTPEGSMAQWESPERDGALHTEHLDFHDFETCMAKKGWERVKHVPYAVADSAREVYVNSILDEEYRTKTSQEVFKLKEEKSDFEDLNE